MPLSSSESRRPRWLANLLLLTDAQECAWFLIRVTPHTPRAHAVRLLREEAQRLLRRARNQSPGAEALQALCWPLLLPVKAWLGAQDEPGLGSRLRLALNNFSDLLLHNLRANSLRTLRERRSDGTSLAALFVHERENQVLIQRLLAVAASAKIGSKSAFSTFCAEHALPSIPALATGRGGDIHLHTANWPAVDLFVKADQAWGGQGAAILRHDPDAQAWRTDHGTLVSPKTLSGWGAAQHPGTAWIIQRRLTPDPRWADWTGGAVGTLRVVTVIAQPGGEPEVIFTCLRLPRAGMIVDNYLAGGLWAVVDSQSGLLQPALARPPRRAWYDHHPDTGMVITGRAVPCLAESLALACKAHAAAPDLSAVGWDVALADAGPLLVEANPFWNLAQTALLGETRWTETLINRLARNPGIAHRWPAAI